MDEALLGEFIEAALERLDFRGRCCGRWLERLHQLAQLDLLALVGCAAFLRKADPADRSFMLWHVL